MTLHRETTQLRSFDGLRLHAARWIPDGEPKALLLIIHGYSEHGGRYEHVARYLAERGFAVASLDYRGHGRSEGARATVARFPHTTADVEACYAWARQLWPDKPVYIIGHSMGALVTLLFALSPERDVAGVVLSGAPLDAASTPTPLVWLSKVLNRVKPGWRVVPLNRTAVTRSAEVLKATALDPLMERVPLSAHLAYEIIQEARHVLSRLPELKIPILYLHGEADTIVGAAGSREAYTRTGSSDKTLKIYPGLYHELFNEPEREQILNDVVTWLEARLARPLIPGRTTRL